MQQPRTRTTLSRAQLQNISADSISGQGMQTQLHVNTPSSTKHFNKLPASESVGLPQLVVEPLWPPAVNLADKNFQERLNILGCLGWQLLDEKHGGCRLTVRVNDPAPVAFDFHPGRRRGARCSPVVRHS